MQHTGPASWQSRIVVPSREDPLLRRITEPIGGPLGRHTAPGLQRTGFFTVERVLVLAVLGSAMLALVIKDHCRRIGWITPDQYSTACYSALPNAFEQFSLDRYLPYLGPDGGGFDAPPLAALFAALSAWLSGFGGATGASRVLVFFDIAALCLVLAWLLATLALAWVNRHRPWDAAVLAISPLLLFTAFTGWQMWAVALILIGLLLFSRSRRLGAGIAFGAAAGVQPAALLISAAILLLAGRRGEPARVTVLPVVTGTILAWLTINLPVLLIAPQAWLRYWADGWAAESGAGSWMGVVNAVGERLGVLVFTPTDAAIVSGGLFVAGASVLAWFVWAMPAPPRLAQLSFPLLAWFLLVNKNTAPQDLMLLLPLLVLARPRWPLILGWQLSVLLYYLAYLMYQGVVLGTNNTRHGIDLPYYALALLLATIATLVAATLMLRDAMSPRSVRAVTEQALRTRGRHGGDPLWPPWPAPRLPTLRDGCAKVSSPR